MKRKIWKNFGTALLLGCIIIGVGSVDPYMMDKIDTVELLRRWFWCAAIGYGAWELMIKRKKVQGNRHFHRTQTNKCSRRL